MTYIKRPQSALERHPERFSSSEEGAMTYLETLVDTAARYPHLFTGKEADGLRRLADELGDMSQQYVADVERFLDFAGRSSCEAAAIAPSSKAAA